MTIMFNHYGFEGRRPIVAFPDIADLTPVCTLALMVFGKSTTIKFCLNKVLEAVTLAGL